MITRVMDTYPDLPAEENALVAEAARSPQAFARLYQRHFGRVYRYLLARTGDHQDAQDLAAQTFLAALEGLSGYRGSGSFAAWLFGIARRKTAGHFRRRTPLPLEAAEHRPIPGPSPEALAFEHLEADRLAGALSALAPDRAEAIRLCIFADLSAAEAAQVLGKSPAAVKMLLYRGLQDLRARFGPADEPTPAGRSPEG